ncbi:MAG: CAP domain-containing protein [Rhodomicrobium sp.]
MGRIIRIVLVCAALGGCATPGSLPSLSSVGGASESEKPAKTETAAAATPAESSSTVGSIWKHFSSTFSSGAQPVAVKPGDGSMPAGLNADDALRLINNFRASKHLPPLSVDPQATAAAELIAQDMAKHDRKTTNTAELGKRLLEAGYSYGLAAENASVGQTSIGDAIDGWKKRADASRNMLLPAAKHIGIAYAYKPDTKYKTFWTLIVAAP